MKRRLFLLAIVIVTLFALAWAAIRTIQGVSVAAIEVAPRPLVQTVVATGRVVAASRVQAGSQITGVVRERRVKEGDVVQAGDILAVLRADDLEAALNEAKAALAQLQQSTLPQAEAALREAEIRLAQASREVQRRRILFQQHAVSQEDMEQAVQAEAAAQAATAQARLTAQSLMAGNPNEAAARARVASARALLGKTTIRAEVAGTVLTRNAEPGDVVQPGNVLFEIASDGDTEVLVPLDEKNLSALALGQSAMSIADAYPARPFPTKVTFIAPRVDPQRGTVDIRLTVDPVPDFLRQDMTISVNVETGRRDSAIVVPNNVLSVIEADRAELWRVVDGRATRQQVQLGLRDIAQTEVTAGLKSGDWVLTDPHADLVEGERVRVVPDKLRANTENHSTRQELPFGLD